MKNLSQKESWMDILKSKFKNADADDILLTILLGAVTLFLITLAVGFAIFVVKSLF